MRIISIIKRLIFLQLILICFICLNLYIKNNALANRTNISPLNNNAIQQIKTPKLKYFYDFKPNEIATFSADFLPKPITIKYNDDGLNDTQNYFVDKDPNTFRIIALGDSFTYGLNVETKNNWTEILERKLNEKPICKNINKFEIINLGVPGYDYQYEIEKYKKTGQKYNPDLIIWMLVQADRTSEYDTPIINECTKNKPNGDIPSAQRKNLLECFNYLKSYKEQKYKSEELNNFQSDNIDKINYFYHKKIIFIDFWNTHQNIINKLHYTNYSSLNFNQKFNQKTKKQTLIFKDGHPNVQGHQLTANIIFDELFNTNQIPCDPL